MIIFLKSFERLSLENIKLSANSVSLSNDFYFFFFH